MPSTGPHTIPITGSIVFRLPSFAAAGGCDRTRPAGIPVASTSTCRRSSRAAQTDTSRRQAALAQLGAAFSGRTSSGNRATNLHPGEDMPKSSSQRPLSSSAAVAFGSAVFESPASRPAQHLFGNDCLSKKFSLAVRLIRPVLLVSVLAVAPALGQTAGGLPVSGIGFAGVSSARQPGVPGAAPAGIPLGSTELQTHGESPAIIRPGFTPLIGTGAAGSSGIPLASTQLTNPGLSPSRRLRRFMQAAPPCLSKQAP
jgi:hypothetical protein